MRLGVVARLSGGAPLVTLRSPRISIREQLIKKLRHKAELFKVVVAGMSQSMKEFSGLAR